MDMHAQHALRPGSERRLDALKHRFRALRAWRKPWRRLRYWVIPLTLGASAGLGGVSFYDLAAKFGSANLAVRHIASALNCDAARAQGLAPARRGGPGYYATHDRDNDGIACEFYVGLP